MLDLQHVWANRGDHELLVNKGDDKLEQIIASQAVPTGRLPAHISGIPLPLDDNLPRNNMGELITAGDQLMLGYLNEEQKTSRLFVQVDGISYYKTGDFFERMVMSSII